MSCLENELAIRLPQRTSRGVPPTNAASPVYRRTAPRHADDAIRQKRAFPVVRERRNAPSTASILHTVYPRHAGKLVPMSDCMRWKAVRNLKDDLPRRLI